MISPEQLYHHLKKSGIGLFTGVPDSLLKDFLLFLDSEATNNEHIIAANEGLATALAIGYHFATEKIPLVYLQNSGLGNIINPITSLADPEIYSIPMLLMIGWRGQPGVKDEPQHKKMGRITPAVLDALEIPFHVLSSDQETTFNDIQTAAHQAKTNSCPVALLVPEGIFEVQQSKPATTIETKYELSRETVIQQLIGHLNGDEIVICTTGKAGREFNEANIAAGYKISKYLLSVGGMGHANHIALAVSKNASAKIIMLDGDGALLMHMGSMTTIGQIAGDNFLHIVINNGAHESVGGQPTTAFDIDLCNIALSCGYRHAKLITNARELNAWLKNDLGKNEQTFVEIRTNASSREDLSRPAGKAIDWKTDFMNALKKND